MNGSLEFRPLRTHVKYYSMQMSRQPLHSVILHTEDMERKRQIKKIEGEEMVVVEDW